MFEQAHEVRADALERSVAILVVVGDGVSLISNVSSAAASGPRGQHLRSPSKSAPRQVSNLEDMVTQVSDALLGLDEDPEYGLSVPVVVIGYHKLGRSASVRSNMRVITHIIANLSIGRHSAAFQQMVMYAAGMSTRVRLRLGLPSL